MRHRQNHRNFKESDSTDQSIDHLKHHLQGGCPLKAVGMDTDAFGTEANSNDEAVPGKTGKPPPIIPMSATNLIQLQKQLKNVVKENFEFCSTRNGTRVIMRRMADFQSVKSH
jgi:hypothetical protein